MAAPDNASEKTLANVVDQLQTLNDQTEDASDNQQRSGAQVVKHGKLASVFAWLSRRAAKKRAAKLLSETETLRHLQTEQIDKDREYQAEDIKGRESTDQHTKKREKQEDKVDKKLHVEVSAQTGQLDSINVDANETSELIQKELQQQTIQQTAELEAAEPLENTLDYSNEVQEMGFDTLKDVGIAAADLASEDAKKSRENDDANLEGTAEMITGELERQTSDLDKIKTSTDETVTGVVDSIESATTASDAMRDTLDEIASKEVPEQPEILVEIPEQPEIQVEIPEQSIEIPEQSALQVELPEQSEIKVEVPEQSALQVEIPEQAESEMPEDQSSEQIDLQEGMTEHLAAIHEDLLAITDVIDGMNQSTLDTLGSLQESIEPNTSIFESLKMTATSTLNVLGNILNLMIDDSAAAREAAREAARAASGGGKEAAGVPDAKVEEAKAGGFFSKMGSAIMNPVKALGAGMKAVGKGVEGFLTGLARGLLAFANPMILVGVGILALSLPILAAGLAAAFKVFDMIMGEGKAMEMITGIIKALGAAVAWVLERILVGIGKMIAAAGPGITAFFEGIAVVLKALHPIIVDVFKVIADIIKDPVFNKTLQAVLKTVQILIVEIGKVIAKVGDIIIAVVKNIGGIIESVGKAISGVITAIGDSVSKVIDSIGGLIKSIGDTVVTVIDGVVSGIERLSALGVGNLLGVAAGLVALAGALMLFSVGAALAGAIMPSRETIEGMAENVERFGAIDPTNLFEVGKGMAAVGAGVAVFGVGSAIGGATMPGREVIEGMASSVERFGNIPSSNLAAVGEGMKKIGEGLVAFGVGGALADLMNPGEAGLALVAKNVEMFGNVPSDNLAAVGTGMKLLGEGLEAFGIGGFVANLLNDPAGLEGVAASVSKFGAIDATNFNMVGTGIQKIGAGLEAFGVGGFISGLAEGFGKWIGASDPVEKFQKFATIGPGLKDASDGIAGLSNAINIFGDADVDDAADGLEKFIDSLDPAKLEKVKGALAGLSMGEMFKGGVYTLSPVLGVAHEGGTIPETGMYQLEQEETVLTKETMGQFSQGIASLSSMQTGEELTGLQKEHGALTGEGTAPIVINSPTTNQVNQTAGPGLILPPSPISAQQSDVNSGFD